MDLANLMIVGIGGVTRGVLRGGGCLEPDERLMDLTNLRIVVVGGMSLDRLWIFVVEIGLEKDQMGRGLASNKKKLFLYLAVPRDGPGTCQ